MRQNAFIMTNKPLPPHPAINEKAMEWLEKQAKGKNDMMGFWHYWNTRPCPVCSQPFVIWVIAIRERECKALNENWREEVKTSGFRQVLKNAEHLFPETGHWCYRFEYCHSKKSCDCPLCYSDKTPVGHYRDNGSGMS